MARLAVHSGLGVDSAQQIIAEVGAKAARPSLQLRSLASWVTNAPEKTKGKA